MLCLFFGQYGNVTFKMRIKNELLYFCVDRILRVFFFFFFFFFFFVFFFFFFFFFFLLMTRFVPFRVPCEMASDVPF